MISIIMPIKNALPYLKECITSIINQSLENWELIAVDDGSNDGSFEFIQKCAKKDSRIKPLKSSKKGIIPALQMGYKFSQGSYITRMDADDIMPKTKLETLLLLLSDKKESKFLATGGVKYFSADQLGDGYQKYEKWLNTLCKSNNHFTYIYKECVIPSPCWMVSRDNFELCGAFFSNIYPEDYDLSFRFYKENFRVVSSTKILHFWRDYENRTSRTDSHYKDSSFIELKLKYFLELDYNPKKGLALWGAGRKGKRIAKILLNNNIKFRWFCNNPKKVSQKIYDVKLENGATILSNYYYLLAISSPKEIIELETKFSKQQLKLKEDYISFF